MLAAVDNDDVDVEFDRPFRRARFNALRRNEALSFSLSLALEDLEVLEELDESRISAKTPG